MKDIEILRNLFVEVFGSQPSVKKIAGGGSPREYYRLQDNVFSVIGVIGEDIKENETFINLDYCLEENGINVPHVVAVDKNKKCYLLEDLGDVSLFNKLGSGQKNDLSRMALKELIRIQKLPESLWKHKVGFSPFNGRLVKWDLNYFKYDFLKPAGILFDEEKLEDDFESLTHVLVDGNDLQGFMYRDFQSRNIMVYDDELWFIDFQGARKGPMVYDAVSYIWQAKAPFTYEEREDLGMFYAGELGNRIGVDPEKIIEQMYPMEVFRTLQVLGAYGFRGLIERKAHFLESIPYAVRNLQYLKEKGRLQNYPEIEKIADILKEKGLGIEESEKGILTIKIFSFSYKKGYPEDRSGNGGGFMFDCRAIHNPGRYEEYRDKNGKDKEVIEFLEKTGEAERFVDNAFEIVRPSIDRYLERGFTSLQVGFGCTGGQHRSVYCAERFGRMVRNYYPDVKLEMIHREQFKHFFT